MKFYIYFDVAPWMRDEQYIYPTTNPQSPKTAGIKRYRVEVEVDDPAEPDETMQERAKEVRL